MNSTGSSEEIISGHRKPFIKESTRKVKRTMKPGYNPNKARNQRREELIYLRNMISRMEKQLMNSNVQTRIKENSTAHPDRSPMPPTQPSPTRLNSAWEGIAARQYKNRQRVEMENIRLKLLLEGQIKEAKRFLENFRRYCKSRACAYLNGIHTSQPLDVSAASNDDVAIFSKLFEDISYCRSDLESVFTDNGLIRMTKPYQDARVVDCSNQEVTKIEIIDSVIMPFSVPVAASAAWSIVAHQSESSLLNQDFKKRLEIPESFEIDSHYRCLIGKHNRLGGLHTRRIMYQMAELDQTIITWYSHSKSLEVLGERMDSQLLEKGYMVIKKLNSNTSSYSLVQICCIVEPKLNAATVYRERDLKIICQCVLDAVPVFVGSILQRLENDLLDQALSG